MAQTWLAFSLGYWSWIIFWQSVFHGWGAGDGCDGEKDERGTEALKESQVAELDEMERLPVLDDGIKETKDIFEWKEREKSESRNWKLFKLLLLQNWWQLFY